MSQESVVEFDFSVPSVTHEIIWKNQHFSNDQYCVQSIWVELKMEQSRLKSGWAGIT